MELCDKYSIMSEQSSGLRTAKNPINVAAISTTKNMITGHQ